MNIAKLNTASLDDKTYIIKRGTSGGGSTPDTPSVSSWRYFDVTNLSDKTMAKNLLPFLVKGNNSISFSLLIENWTNT